MIKLLRIDDRLLHGQVAFVWTKVLGIDTILVANDIIAKDEITKMTLSIAKPRGTNLVIKNMVEGIQVIKENLSGSKNWMIIVNNVIDAHAIVMAIPEITSVNFGGLKQKDNTSKRFTSSGTLTIPEVACAKELAASGVELEVRQVPEEKKTIINQLL